jgi:hypothetical protein
MTLGWSRMSSGGGLQISALVGDTRKKYVGTHGVSLFVDAAHLLSPARSSRAACAFGACRNTHMRPRNLEYYVYICMFIIYHVHVSIHIYVHEYIASQKTCRRKACPGKCSTEPLYAENLSKKEAGHSDIICCCTQPEVCRRCSGNVAPGDVR